MKLALTIALASIFALSAADLMSDSLTAHNRYRAAAGVPNLTWNPMIAMSAQAWADYLAKNGGSANSRNTINIGENLAFGDANTDDVQGFIDQWGAEANYFIAGMNYPQCTSGSESDVWHYTQMIWEKSTQLGCGLGSNDGKLYYVCQYNPSGNIYGAPVYSGSSSPSTPVPEPEIPTYQPEIPTPQPEIPTYQPEIPTYQPQIPTPQPEIPTYQPQTPVYQPPVPTPQPQTPVYQPNQGDPLISESLAAHSKWRSAVGVPDLVWDENLARGAQAWAENCARANSMAHSKTSKTGENIAYSTNRGVTGLVDMWAEERENFIPGRNYPECTTTGDTSDVGHYTQMVWRESTKVGCGMATSSNRRKYYVCQYYPQGNMRGRPVY